MEEQHKAGLAKNIGVSNVAGALLTDIFRFVAFTSTQFSIAAH